MIFKKYVLFRFEIQKFFKNSEILQKLKKHFTKILQNFIPPLSTLLTIYEKKIDF